MKSQANFYSSRLWLSVVILVWSGSAQSQGVEVNSAEPSSAEQGTFELDVEISGSGFDNSAAVDFWVTGTTNPGGITVKNVKVRGNKKIIATIDVDDGATVDDFDIEVSLSSGRKGKGTTLFRVQAKPNGKPSDEYTSPNEGVQFITPSDVAGFDYHIIGTSDRDDIIAGEGKDLIESGATRDYIFARGNDDVVYGNDGSDILHGDEGNDLLHGDADGDLLSGGPGTDSLFGGSGNDTLVFSLGSFTGIEYELDTFDGGDGVGDRIDFHDLPEISSVSVDLALQTYDVIMNTADLGDIAVSGTFASIESAWGSEGDDLIFGTDGDENSTPDQAGGLYGSGGSDTIYGLSGNDAVWGGHGDDTLYGGPGDDWIRGYWGADVMDGGDGADYFELFEGESQSDDWVTGGPGCDYFVFGRQFGTDVITDFDDSCEIIDLSGYNPKYRLDFGDLSVSTSGGDIVISFWFNKQGGAGGTIVLEGAVANGVTIDPGDFVF